MSTSTLTLPAVAFKVAFNADPNDPLAVPVWTDLSHRLVAIQNAKRGKDYEIDQAQSQEWNLKLRNSDGFLDPTNTASPYWPNVLPYRMFQLLVTIGVTTYTALEGFIESWPQTWEGSGNQGWVVATATDVLAPLSQIILDSALMSEVELLAPYAYWPLNEPENAAVAGQIMPGSDASSLTFQTSGLGDGTADFGTAMPGLLGAGATDGTDGPIVGDTTGFHFAPLSLGDGEYLQGAINLSPGSTISLEAWIQDYTSTQAFGFITLYSDDFSNQVSLSCDTGFLLGSAIGSSGGLTSVLTAGARNDGKLHHLVVTIGAGTLSFFMDGVLIGTIAFGASLSPLTKVLLGTGGFSGGVPLAFGAYTIAHAAIYPTALTPGQVQNNYLAGSAAFAGEDTGARFSRILRYAGWNGTATVPAGNTILQGCTAIANQSALAALLDVCQWEVGNLYADNVLGLVFENRYNRITQATKWTLGEQAGSGEQPYQGDIAVDFDPQQVFNEFALQRPGGTIAYQVDAASVKRYFPRSYPQTPLVVPLTDDQTLVYLSQWLVQRYKDPHARVSPVTFNPTSNPALWPFVLGVKIGDRVTAKRRPRDAAVITLDTFVESIQHDYDANTGVWTTSLELSPAYWQNYGILTAARGTLHASVLAGATTLVLDVATTAGNTLDQDGWTVSAIPVLVINDGANTEAVTVSNMAIAAGQVTVTCSALLHGHSAAVVVSENLGSYTYNQFDASAVLDGAHALGY